MKLFASVLAVGVLLSGAGYATEYRGGSKADYAAIEAIEPAWKAAYQARDVEGLLALYTDDAWIMARRRPAVQGREEMRKLFSTIVNGVKPDIASATDELVVKGDWAWTVSKFVLTYTPAGGGPATYDYGRAILIYEKGKDRKWRISRDIDTPSPDAFGLTPAGGGPVITPCDRLAAHGDDPDAIAPGVATKDVDIPAAIAACEAAVAADPQNLRVRYQLARVLFYGKQDARALKEMQAVADAGYRQAQFVFGAFINNKRPGAPQDPCVLEQYWLKSARAGRQAARLSYVRHATKGKFKGCQTISKTEMEQLLTIAAKAEDDYYQRLLIEDLRESLAKMSG